MLDFLTSKGRAQYEKELQERWGDDIAGALMNGSQLQTPDSVFKLRYIMKFQTPDITELWRRSLGPDTEINE